MTATNPQTDPASGLRYLPTVSYVGSDDWRAERTQACLELCVLAIDELKPEEAKLVVRVVNAFTDPAAPSVSDDAAQLLVLGAVYHAREDINDVQRLLFAEVAVPHLLPTSRAKALAQVQEDVDEWHRALNADEQDVYDIESETYLSIEQYAEKFLTSATKTALAYIEADKMSARMFGVEGRR